MRPSTAPPFAYRSWMIALLIGLVFVGLAYGLRYEVEGSASDDQQSWLDLALLLCGYLFLFYLKPIQQAVERRLRRRATEETPR